MVWLLIAALGHAEASPDHALTPTSSVAGASTLPRPRVYSCKWFPKDDAKSEISGSYLGAPDRKFIYINQNQQMIYIFLDGKVIRRIPCSTGLPTWRTRTLPWLGRVGEYWGTFQAYSVWADDAWFLFKDDGSILIHGAPYTYVDDAKVYQDLDALGARPASHGCIRIAPEDARWLTAWGPAGALTLITPLTVSYIYE